MRDIARMLGDSEATTERVYAKYHPDYLKTASGALIMDPSAFKARRPTPEAALESALKERGPRGKPTRKPSAN
jgi:hypothetical protein